MRTEGLTPPIAQKLQGFLSDIQRLPNEAAKAARFVALVQDLFGSTPITELVEGIEKRVRIQTRDIVKSGRIDALYGNAVIEFENSLRATGKTAEHQLREYAAGVWKEEGKPYRPLVCLATDGEEWRTYLPSLRDSSIAAPCPEDVVFGTNVARIVLSPETLRDFWLWLTSFLFRPARIDPTADRFRMDFGARSPLFIMAMEILGAAWNSAKTHPDANLALRTWRRYLAVTYGNLTATDEELTPLFLKHSYLACIARILAWAALSKGQIRGPYAKVVTDILSGEYFVKHKIQNLVEDDFFHWVHKSVGAAELLPLWEGVLSRILNYDLSRIDQDVLKSVYQELVDPKDRHDLGEYYTPDWLCERIVQKTLPATGFPSVLDPTCGSGSFLRNHRSYPQVQRHGTARIHAHQHHQ